VKWRSIKTAPRDENGYILVFVPSIGVTLAWFDDFNHHWIDATVPDYARPAIKPTHWMLLPEPPQ
jgi:hypothetical protein